MDSMRQRLRPKHQVLILKCYPKHQKNSVEVKPNSSELSYLLYYASTRRTKLQKVGDFLEKRTINDVWKGRIGNVSVTLQILKALIEKNPRDLPLYVSTALRIFKTILDSKDVTMIEETVPTFETFCSHQDPANLAADQEYIRQYEDIIRMYATFASKDTPVQTKTAKSIPVLIRYRKAGLEAIKAIAASESLTAETGRQLNIIVAPVLENIYSSDGRYLSLLESTEEEKIEIEKQIAIKRRQSSSTVRTTETNEADPIAASGTTEAADRLAEQEAAILALQALKQIFSVVPKSQLRLATNEVLTFIALRITMKEHFSMSKTISLATGSWPCTLFAMIAAWAPVQDRFVILVSAMENLVQSPIIEDDLEKQCVLATIIHWLLSADINLIGLSVMDVLVGLIQHILLLLQLGGTGTSITPHEQQSIDPAEGTSTPTSSVPEKKDLVMEIATTPSPIRKLLLAKLQQCIGGLAVHVYYSEQIIDMVHAILTRLKPSVHSSISSTASAIENPAAAVDAIATAGSLNERQHTDGFFSFDTARMAALAAIKEIILCANRSKVDGASNSTNRTPVTVLQWEGTQWLLRDPRWEGRTAYIDALLVWMRYELKKGDLRIEEEPRNGKGERKENSLSGTNLAKRAVSNASQRDCAPILKRNHFLQLLHLAIYENAHHCAESESDILLLHLLLWQMVQSMGINAVKYGFPMMMRLQDDIDAVESPLAKINLGSLVHGYLWTISEFFDFDGSSLGRKIHNEIARRLEQGMWLQNIRVPPLTLEQVVSRKGTMEAQPPAPEVVANGSLKPFDDREPFVDKITEGYSSGLRSPPSSPPTSPLRSYSIPMLGHTHSASFQGAVSRTPQLPSAIKEAMLAEWTREECIAATIKTEGSRTGSLSGTGSPTTSQPSSKLLVVGVLAPPGYTPNGSQMYSNGDSLASPNRASHYAHLRGSRPSSQIYAHGLVHHGSLKKDRSRRPSQSPTPLSTSSVPSAVRVEDLKAVLSGSTMTYSSLGTSHGQRMRAKEAENDDTGSESLASYDGVSEASYTTPNEYRNSQDKMEPARESIGTALSTETTQDTAGTTTPRPLSNVSTARPLSNTSLAVPGDGTISPLREDFLTTANPLSEYEDADIPPVPPLPPNVKTISPSTTTTRLSPPESPKTQSPAPSLPAASARPRSTRSTFGSRTISAALSSATSGGGMHESWHAGDARRDYAGFNGRELLEEIDADKGVGFGVGVGLRRGSHGRPPY